MYFSYDEHELCELNFTQRLTKVKALMTMWKQRNLTMLGRIQIVKTFCISQFLYILGAIVIPEGFVKLIEIVVWNFVWNGKREKIKRTVLCKPLEKGGLNAPDFRIMIKASKLKWIQWYIGKHDHAWINSCDWFMKKSNVCLPVMLQSDFDLTEQMKSSLPMFYTQILELWSHVGNTKLGKDKYFGITKTLLLVAEVYTTNISVRLG